MTRLPTPEPGRGAAEAFVAEHLGHLVCDEIKGSQEFSGGQTAADAALAGFDVAGYARNRNEVLPAARRGASALSPYIRHGLLTLRQVWHHVAGGPERDVKKFRDELLWQEFARHWYSRLGSKTRRGVHNALMPTETGDFDSGWDRRMACMDNTIGELLNDGWLVNQTRMWLSSHWSVREGLSWQEGEDHFFRHLLDGSRAANRLGWQWTTGTGSSKHYGFSRYQVEKRAGVLCNMCAMKQWCPIEEWPHNPPLDPVPEPVELRRDPHGIRTSGPKHVVETRPADTVWLTAESLGFSDPALVARTGLPVAFVFDQPLLESLQLSSKRLVFLTEVLAELGATLPVELHLGAPVDVLRERAVAVTFAPVPGFRRRAEAIVPAETHPWPWLAQPSNGPITSFSAWRKSIRVPRHGP
jgi:deoxyribodipyrimidine photo-lyase